MPLVDIIDCWLFVVRDSFQGTGREETSRKPNRGYAPGRVEEKIKASQRGLDVPVGQ